MELDELFSALTPGTLLIIKEQLTEYRKELGSGEGEMEGVDEVLVALEHAYGDKTDD